MIMDQLNQNLRRPDAVGIHSVDHFVFSVPALDEAERFYRAFGLDVRASADRLHLHTEGHPHCWATVFMSSEAKRLEYVRFGIYVEDEELLRQRVTTMDLACEPHPLAEAGGIWLRNPDGTPWQLVVAPKVSPSSKTRPTLRQPAPEGVGAAPSRSRAPGVRPRALSHVLFFTPDVRRMSRFCIDVLGLRLSDESAGNIVFLHGVHGSDHHLVTFACSYAPGLHHSSWDVGSIDEVGGGAEQMRQAGYTLGWGLGRHVLGSNYFHYVRDPWGSFSEYSFDIDYIPHDLNWVAADHPPEDSLYVWGPPVPEDFIVNHE